MDKIKKKNFRNSILFFLCFPEIYSRRVCKSTNKNFWPNSFIPYFSSALLRPVIVLMCRCVFLAGGFHWISVKGRKARAEEAPIIALAPHSSYLDALPVVYLELPSVVAKAEAASVPLFGSMLWF